eukprot:1194007-Prorocentrum_minimum.AAC.1
MGDGDVLWVSMIAGLVLVCSRPAQRTGPLAPLFPAPRGNRRRLLNPLLRLRTPCTRQLTCTV